MPFLGAYQRRIGAVAQSNSGGKSREKAEMAADRSLAAVKGVRVCARALATTWFHHSDSQSW